MSAVPVTDITLFTAGLTPSAKQVDVKTNITKKSTVTIKPDLDLIFFAFIFSSLHFKIEKLKLNVL